jgi:hypothetical protein
VAALVVVGLILTLVGISFIDEDPEEDDDPALVLVFVAGTNYLGWTVGLVGGAAVARRRMSTRAS